MSTILVELRANAGEFMAKMGAARAEVAKLGTESSAHMEKFQTVGKYALLGVASAATVVGVESIKMAGNFQQSMTQLVTGAGEAESNMKMVSAGILDLSTKVGYSAQELAKGMYLIESAGYRGAAGLDVLKASAEGARAGNAEMATVADALTTALNAYHLPASQAIQVTNELIATEQVGKTTMEQLAGSLGSVVPAASVAGVSLQQVLGAMATMTSAGTSADKAATYLRQTILQLSNPTAKARAEMENLGLSAIDVSKNLGTRGLTGTLDLLTAAIVKHMGPQGTVLIENMKKAANSTTAFQQILANLAPTQQTYIGALATMVGGTKSMQAALELTSGNAKVFAGNVEHVSAASKGASKDVTDWALVQNNFNLKLANLKNELGKVAIEIGNRLIPLVEKSAAFFARHTKAATALAVIIGGALLAAITAYIGGLIVSAAKTLILIERTIALFLLNRQAVGSFGAVAAAMGGEATAATVLAAALRAVALAAAAAAAALVIYGAQKWASSMNQSIDAQHAAEDRGGQADMLRAPMDYARTHGLLDASSKNRGWNSAIAAAARAGDLQKEWTLVRGLKHSKPGERAPAAAPTAAAAAAAKATADLNAAMSRAGSGGGGGFGGGGGGGGGGGHVGRASKAAAAHGSAANKIASAHKRAAAAAAAAAAKIQHAHEKAAKAAAAAAKKAALSMLADAKATAAAAAAEVGKAIASMTKDLDGLKKERDNLASSLQQGIQGNNGQVAPLFDATLSNPVSAMMTSLQGQLTKTQQFGSQLSGLATGGASKDLISQVAQMGADAGGALADSLLKQGPGAIKAMSDLMGQISAASKAAADAIAGQYYDQGIASMQSLIDGMTSKEKALQAEVDKIAAIMKSLNSGKISPAAAAAGLKAIHAPAGHPTVAAAPVHVHFNVDGKELAHVVTPFVRTQLLQQSRRLGSLGLA